MLSARKGLQRIGKNMAANCMCQFDDDLIERPFMTKAVIIFMAADDE